MSTFLDTLSAARPIRSGLSCLALCALAGMVPAIAAAAVPEPTLRASRQLDATRLGKVSENERAVLRVEWRSAMTSAEEAQAVQQMLDSLRRMEDTTAQIGRLVRGIPAPRPAVTVAPAEVETDIRSLATGAALATLLLLPVFWFARRKAAAGIDAPTRIEPPLAAPVEPPPPEEIAAAEQPAESPHEKFAQAIDLPLESAPAVAVDPGPEPEAAAAPQPAPLAAEVSAAPAPVANAAPAEPAPETTEAPLHPAEIPPIEFSLEDEDPETIARANARIPVPRKPSPTPHVPERRQEVAIEPTLQLAEIMLSMGLTQGAAQTLIEYTDANPRQAVYHWLKLLAIYRDTGQRKDFEETAEKLRKFFNIQAAGTASADPGEPPTLESFPRIAEQVVQLWSQPEQCQTYLRQLLEDNRNGSRIGFPQSVAEEFLLLGEILKMNAGGRQGDASQRSTT
jgi:hypothetical protein